MTRRKLIAFASITALIPVVLMTGALLGADLYLHKRAERSAGLNRWGYRGPVVGGKLPGETRIAVLGGSTAFGYGVLWSEAPAAVLEQQLRANRTAPLSVVNLGFNNEGAYSYRFTLDDFRFLDFDIVVLFDGYNDMTGDDGRNTSLFRHDSPVFRLTGYYPILPLVFAEKAMMLRTGGNLMAGYEELHEKDLRERLEGRGEKVEKAESKRKTVFSPSLADRASAAALESTVAVTESLGRQLGRLSTAPVAPSQPAERQLASDTGCAFPWSFYCQSMRSAVSHALDLNKRVVVVLQPRLLDPIREAHVSQQSAVSDLLTRNFGSNPRFRLADLTMAVNLGDVHDCFDGMHLTRDGIKREIAALMTAVDAGFWTAQ